MWFGGKAARVLRTTVYDSDGEPTHKVAQSVKPETEMHEVLSCGLLECRALIGLNGASIIRCDAPSPNVDLLKEELARGWTHKCKNEPRRKPAVLDRSLEVIPETEPILGTDGSTDTGMVVYPAYDSEKVQRDLVTGPMDGESSFVGDALVVRPGGHKDRLLAENPARLGVPLQKRRLRPTETDHRAARRIGESGDAI